MARKKNNGEQARPTRSRRAATTAHPRASRTTKTTGRTNTATGRPRSARVERDPTFEQIRERAYYLYLERGAIPGRDLEDWLRAEHELRRGGG